VNFWKIIR